MQRKSSFMILVLAMLLCGVAIGHAAEKKVLVYTKNGKGFIHDNIQASVDAIKKMGKENGFGVDVSNDPKVFTDENLKQYRALVFSNSNNEAFDTEAQRTAFKKYIQSGGGFVGIHSASGSERKWPYFWAVLGGKFVRHPKFQKFTLNVVDRNHPATAQLAKTLQWEDECYYLDNLNPDIHVLLTADLTTIDDPGKAKYPGTVFGTQFPLVWCQEFDGGREFYTAIGHKIEHYSDPNLVKIIQGGILWAMGEKSATPQKQDNPKAEK